MAITTALFFAAFAAAHRVASEEAVNQQEAQNKLVGTVIEYIKGMPVVKAFNLAGNALSCRRKSYAHGRISHIPHLTG